MKKQFLFLMGAALAIGLAGCVEGDVRKQEIRLGSTAKKQYAPVNASTLQLKMTSSRSLRIGEGGELIFSLINTGRRPVRIEEWYANESDNLRLLCQIWSPDMESPDESAWLDLAFEVKKPDRRIPLEIQPGNRILISKTLPFVDRLRLQKGYERRYFVKAKSNLKSLRLESPAVGIAVRGREK